MVFVCSFGWFSFFIGEGLINGTTYNVAPGSYNLNDLLQAIVNLTNVAITYYDIPNLITISNTTAFTLNCNIPNSISYVYGFNPNLTYSGQTSAPSKASGLLLFYLFEHG